MQIQQGGAGIAQVLLCGASALRLSCALGLTGLALGTGVPSRAEDAPQPAPERQERAGVTQPALREMVRVRQEEMRGASLKELARSLPPSLPTVLGLDARQVERLDRLWDDFVLSRLEQEGKLARWQDDLQRAQLPTSFDKRKSRGLLKSIADGQDKIRGAFLKARSEAFKVLSPAQRAQVQALASSAKPVELPMQPGSEASAQALPQVLGGEASGGEVSGVPSVREDEYRRLLLMPVEVLLRTPLDTGAVRRLLGERDRYVRSGYGSSRYGSYGYGGAAGAFRGFGWGRGFEFGGIYGHFGHRRGLSGHRQHGGAPH